MFIYVYIYIYIYIYIYMKEEMKLIKKIIFSTQTILCANYVDVILVLNILPSERSQTTQGLVSIPINFRDGINKNKI